MLLVDEDLQDELNQLQINACINVLNTLDDTLLELTKEVCGNARYLIASKNINVKTSHWRKTWIGRKRKVLYLMLTSSEKPIFTNLKNTKNQERRFERQIECLSDQNKMCKQTVIVMISSNVKLTCKWTTKQPNKESHKKVLFYEARGLSETLWEWRVFQRDIPELRNTTVALQVPSCRFILPGGNKLM